MTQAAGPKPETSANWRVVSRFEASLLRILRYFVRQAPIEQALPVLLQKHPRPPCLSSNCLALAQDYLKKGCVLFLARTGGWRRDTYLRSGRPRRGRLWERTSETDWQLAFTAQSMEFLIWMTARSADAPGDWKPAISELSVADQLLLLLAHDALRETEVTNGIRHLDAFTLNALCRLAFPDDFDEVPDHREPDLAPWTFPPGSLILEALQPWLANRWLAVERSKGQVGDWDRLRRLGASQHRILANALATFDRAGRWDLARFVMDAASQLLTVDLVPLDFIGGLQGTGPTRLAERLEVQRTALAPLRQLETLQEWERRARTYDYYDEEYAAGQLWKAEWERWQGDAVVRRAQAVLRQLEPLKMPS